MDSIPPDDLAPVSDTLTDPAVLIDEPPPKVRFYERPAVKALFVAAVAIAVMSLIGVLFSSAHFRF
jgi:hypothetical protein